MHTDATVKNETERGDTASVSITERAPLSFQCVRPTAPVVSVQYVHLNEEVTTIRRGFDSWQRFKWIFSSENPATQLDARNFYNRVWGPAVPTVGIEWATWHDLFANRLAMTRATTMAPLLRCCAIRPRPWSNGTHTSVRRT